jgi:hypothetical protein
VPSTSQFLSPRRTMSQAKPGHDGSPDGVDLTIYPTAKKLAERSLEFLQEIKDLYTTHQQAPSHPPRC